MSAEWHVSLKSQRVSAALASGVNPGSSGAASSSTSLAHTVGSMPHLAGGLKHGNSNLHAPAEEVAKALGAGWLELWYQPKIGSQALTCAGRKRLFACANRGLA